MRHIHLFVAGMSCRRCVREVTGLVRDVPGVETVSANADDCTVRLSGSMQLRTSLLSSPAPRTAPDSTARAASRAAQVTTTGMRQRSASRPCDLGATAEHG